MTAGEGNLSKRYCLKSGLFGKFVDRGWNLWLSHRVYPRSFSSSLVVIVVMMMTGFSDAQEIDLSIPDIEGPDLSVPGIPGTERSAPSGPRVDIQPVFQPGSTYRFIQRTEVQMQIPGQGGREAMVEQQARFDAGIRKDGKAGISLKARTERLKVVLKAGRQSINYDSLVAEDRQTVLGQHLNASLIRWVNIKLNKDHRVVAAEEDGREAKVSPLPEFPRFGLDELQQIAVMIPQGMPKDGVRQGDVWELKGRRRVGEAGLMDFDITYRYRGEVSYEQNRYLQIDLSGQVAGEIAVSGSEESGGAVKKIEFQSPSIVGRILYDPLERMIRLSEQTISLTIEVPGEPGQDPLLVPIQQRAILDLMHIVATTR